MIRAYGSEACVECIGGNVGWAGAVEKGEGCRGTQWQGTHSGRKGLCALYVTRSVREPMASYGSVRRVVWVLGAAMRLRDRVGQQRTEAL
jgi:hypothetical protein